MPSATAPNVPPGVVAIYSDVVCPWATVVIDRMRTRRDRDGVDVTFDLRPFPLESANGETAPLDVVNRSIRAARRAAPDYGFEELDEAPGSSLVALEAIRAAYQQSPRAAEALDTAIRRAIFVGPDGPDPEKADPEKADPEKADPEKGCGGQAGSSRPDIADRDQVLAIAARCEGVDADALRTCLDGERFAADVREHYEGAVALGVEGSPHVFLNDGRSEFLPSLQLDSDGDEIEVVHDDPTVIDDLLVEAAQTRQRD